jgi:hypothetical protein
MIFLLTILIAVVNSLITPIYPTYTRTVIFQKVSVGVSNTQTDLLDIGHVRLRATGLYNDAEIIALRIRAFDYFNTKYGLNMSAAQYFGGGYYYPNLSAPIAVSFPFTLGNDDTTTDGSYPFRFLYDSNDKSVAKKLDWIILGGGWITQMLSTGFFGGESSNTRYAPSDLISNADYNYLKGYDEFAWTNPKYREIIILRSLGTSKQVVNSEGTIEDYVKVEVVDPNGNIGYGMITTTFTNSPVFTNNGTYVQVTSALYQWGKSTGY